ncbi:MAG: (Fe-S)-binding protein [Sphingomonadales bacterium]
MPSKGNNKKVALFATCLVDLWRPSVGRATKSLIEKAGFSVEVPASQTCCGQPNWNSGDRMGAAKLARRHIEMFQGFDFVVVPSGSCADMVKNQYPAIFRDDPEMLKKAQALSRKTYELSEFMIRVANYKPAKTKGGKRDLAYHDSCSCRRALGIETEPRALIESVGGYQVKEMAGQEICCGFGGLFSVKYGEISSHMAGKKTATIMATGAKVLTGADLGCLLNLEGKLRADGQDIEVLHIAEILDGEDQ